MTEHLADLDAERALVAAALMDPAALARVTSLDAEDLYDPTLGTVLRAIRAAWHVAGGRDVDLAAVLAELRRVGRLHTVGGAQGVAALADAYVTSAHVETWAERLAGLARLRRAETILRRALAEVRQGEDEGAALSAALATAQGLGDLGGVARADLAAHAEAAWAEIEARSAGAPAARWGIAALDGPGSLGGLHPGALYTLAADTGGGKTTLAWQAALATARTGLRVVVYSLEMPGPELVLRLAGYAARLSTARIRTGQLGPEEMADLAAATNALSRLPIEVYDRGDLHPDRIALDVQGHAARGGLGLVVVDYLQILQAAPSLARASQPEVLSHATRTLKRAALRARVPVLLLSQFNRGRDPADRPRLHDLKGSGSIEQDSDAVVLLHPRGEDVDAIVAKHRHGPTGPDVSLRWDRAAGRLEDTGTPVASPADAEVLAEADPWEASA